MYLFNGSNIMLVSCDLRVVMYLFECSSHKGGELRSGVPMSKLSLS